MNDIKNNAPDGATLYFMDCDKEVYFYKIIGNELHQWCGDSWSWVDTYDVDYYSGLKSL